MLEEPTDLFSPEIQLLQAKAREEDGRILKFSPNQDPADSPLKYQYF